MRVCGPNKQSQLASVFRASSKNHNERSAKFHNTRPLLVIGWNTVYFGLQWLVVPFVIVCDLGAQADLQRHVFFD